MTLPHRQEVDGPGEGATGIVLQGHVPVRPRPQGLAYCTRYVLRCDLLSGEHRLLTKDLRPSQR